MNYYLDQEFNEGFRKPIKWLPTIGNFNKPYHFIDLISIGLVCEDGREYYAVCNEFDVRSAYNKHIVIPFLTSKNHSTNDRREYWLRDNVLKPIFFSFYKQGLTNIHHVYDMSLSKMKDVVKNSGKSKKQIKLDIYSFICDYSTSSEYAGVGSIDSGWEAYVRQNPPVFYGYYADYDWVLFCSLFGTMMDLPKGFPMYCRDLKQMLDEFSATTTGQMLAHVGQPIPVENEFIPVDLAVERIKKCVLVNFPKQENEHKALADAKWNKKLHDFLNKERSR